MIRPGQWRALRAATPALLLGLALLGLVFNREIIAAVAVWGNSTAYNHCTLVLPIAAWLAYDRRDRLRDLAVQPVPRALALLLPLGIAWLAAERLGIMEGRQFAALGCVEVLALAVLGWQVTRALAAPLLYLVFLVPFGAFLTGALQDFTAHFVVTGLGVLGIANYSDGNTIEIPEGVFFVAEACAGLRFLIAAVAFGVLYALTLYRSPVRRAVFVAVSMVVPVVANGIRALGIVVAGHVMGSAQAAAADHLVYGWLFFSAVILLLIAAGLPFREDARRSPARRPVPPPPPSRLALLRWAVLAAVLAAGAPLAAFALDRTAASDMVTTPARVAGCTPASGLAVDGAGAALLHDTGAVARAFLCDAGSIRLVVAAFPPRTNPMAVLALQRRLTDPQDAEDVDVQPLSAGLPGWLGIVTRNPSSMAATAFWIDGNVAMGGLRSRLLQARNSLVGSDHAVIVAVVSPAAGASASLAALQQAATAVSPQMARIATPAR